MLITVGTSSQRLDAILTPAQKSQIYAALPKNTSDRVLMLKIKTAERSVYVENGAAASETTSRPIPATGIVLPLSGLSDYQLIASNAGTEVYVLQG